ncbi:serine hydrolase domain-containing protein [Fictibacillus phosphorivorans]|uniref:serine hydrolase domain-containing protein n=1 Tax=Fictibacillus phosphorivorans TaxID=1221500 RepID=UPI001293416C|nr:serine hydrolase domain-containing protein [Fictibacillus phosphorivorans]MQR94884.1 class A beta-lactamase-related serine hydrolase [Fictibacillus phosphorivorans]
MKHLVRIISFLGTLILGLTCLTVPLVSAESSGKTEKIEKLVEQQRHISKIPGISLVIVEKGETVYQRNFGYKNVKEKKPVTSSTLFEIGSTTKAFTGLAILRLEKEGKLKRSDSVQKYIPWLKLKYQGELQTITLNQLLYHSSGIASNSIAQIPESTDSNALELNVKTLLNQELNRKPGSTFEYATINYDVLGLVIENVTKQPYDLYIKDEVLKPIGMKDSFVGLHQVQPSMVAQGYKIGFLKEQKYTPPIYRGNIPAGYIISNTTDIAKWMNLQLGYNSINEFNQQLIKESHHPDRSVAAFNKNSYYASGWEVVKKEANQYIQHEGQNPTYSSFIIMQPDKELGVAILSNMNSSVTTSIGQSVMDIWEGKSVSSYQTDSYQKLDKIATVLLSVFTVLGVIFILLSLRTIRMIVRKQRERRALKGKVILMLSIHTLIVAAILILVILIPKILLGYTWTFIQVWGPVSITVLFYSFITTSIIFYVYGVLLILTKKNSLIK